MNCWLCGAVLLPTDDPYHPCSACQPHCMYCGNVVTFAELEGHSTAEPVMQEGVEARPRLYACDRCRGLAPGPILLSPPPWGKRQLAPCAPLCP
jgi:hypothetical protein